MVIIKQCGGCKTFKNIIEFCKCKSGKYGVHNHCRSCAKVHKAKYYVNNRDKEITAAAVYGKSPKGIQARKSNYLKNKDQLLARNRKLRANPRARNLANIARNKKYHNDVSFRISINLRSRTRSALKGRTKSKHTLELLGCSLIDFKNYIENKFQAGMSWDNYCYRGWHLDHIIPCASFDLTKPEEQAKCFHYTNLQPLWMLDNLSKGDAHDSSLLDYTQDIDP